jgi:hypothetical protein
VAARDFRMAFFAEVVFGTNNLQGTRFDGCRGAGMLGLTTADVKARQRLVTLIALTL